MIAMGIWLGAAIDTYSRFTKQRRAFHWLTACNDVLFWIIQGLFVFYILLKVNQGELRFYVFLALVCGYAGYRALLESYYKRFLEKCIQFFISLFRIFRSLFFTLLYNPLKWLLKLLYSLCMMIITALITVVLFLLNLILKPLSWLGMGLYKLTRLDRLVDTVMNTKTIQVVRSFIQRIRKGNKEDE